MTKLSLRVEPEEADEASRWSERLGIDRSELLADALHRRLVELASERDADWGSAEDWSDWADATG